MENENRLADATPTEAIPEPVEETVAPKKKAPPRKRKTRDIGALMEAPINGMTPIEKNNLLKFLKEEHTLLSQQKDLLETNCKDAYSKLRDTEEGYAKTISTLNEKITLMKRNTQVFAKTIIDLI